MQKPFMLTLEKNMLYMSKLYNMSFIDFEVVLIVMYLMICN